MVHRNESPGVPGDLTSHCRGQRIDTLSPAQESTTASRDGDPWGSTSSTSSSPSPTSYLSSPRVSLASRFSCEASVSDANRPEEEFERFLDSLNVLMRPLPPQDLRDVERTLVEHPEPFGGQSSIDSDGRYDRALCDADITSGAVAMDTRSATDDARVSPLPDAFFPLSSGVEDAERLERSAPTCLEIINAYGGEQQSARVNGTQGGIKSASVSPHAGTGLVPTNQVQGPPLATTDTFETSANIAPVSPDEDVMPTQQVLHQTRWEPLPSDWTAGTSGQVVQLAQHSQQAYMLQSPPPSSTIQRYRLPIPMASRGAGAAQQGLHPQARIVPGALPSQPTTWAPQPSNLPPLQSAVQRAPTTSASAVGRPAQLAGMEQAYLTQQRRQGAPSTARRAQDGYHAGSISSTGARSLGGSVPAYGYGQAQHAYLPPAVSMGARSLAGAAPVECSYEYGHAQHAYSSQAVPRSLPPAPPNGTSSMQGYPAAAAVPLANGAQAYLVPRMPYGHHETTVISHGASGSRGYGQYTTRPNVAHGIYGQYTMMPNTPHGHGGGYGQYAPMSNAPHAHGGYGQPPTMAMVASTSRQGHFAGDCSQPGRNSGPIASPGGPPHPTSRGIKRTQADLEAVGPSRPHKRSRTAATLPAQSSPFNTRGQTSTLILPTPSGTIQSGAQVPGLIRPTRSATPPMPAMSIGDLPGTHKELCAKRDAAEATLPLQACHFHWPGCTELCTVDQTREEHARRHCLSITAVDGKRQCVICADGKKYAPTSFKNHLCTAH